MRRLAADAYSSAAGIGGTGLSPLGATRVLVNFGTGAKSGNVALYPTGLIGDEDVVVCASATEWTW